MAFWIVYQGDSWSRARNGGHLWAPKLNSVGRANAYWDNMTRVQPGELIFSGVNNAIRAVSQAQAPAYTAPRPDPDRDGRWDSEGWRLDVAYSDLSPPIPYNDWAPIFSDSLSVKYGAFNASGRPNQGYLFELPIEVGQYIVQLAYARGMDIVATAEEAAAERSDQPTERTILARARIGQGKFRTDLLKLYAGRCAASGLDRSELLRASHIKPWAACSNSERLDPANGLLLSAGYDAAFDAGLISFDDDGKIILAADFNENQARDAGIDPHARINAVKPETALYLASHRKTLGLPRIYFSE